MSRYCDVSLGPGSVQIELENSRSPFLNPGLWMQGPNWRANVQGLPPWVRKNNPSFQGSGKYKESPGISIELLNPDGSRFAYLGLTSGLGGGTAYGVGTGLNTPTGQWRPTDKPVPHSWCGIMVKGSANAVVGAELAAAALLSCTKMTSGCTILSAGAQGGLVAGVSGGLAFVFATGFQTANDFNNYTADGIDWALSFGPKLESFVKGGTKLCTALKGLDAVLARLDSAARAEKLKTLFNTNPELGKEAYGIAKSVWSSSLIDSDLQSITVVDVPLASGGVQIGIYYCKSKFKLASSW